MKRMLLLIFLAAGNGCALDQGSWAEAAKDLRGDNMRMISGPNLGEDPDQSRLSK